MKPNKETKSRAVVSSLYTAQACGIVAEEE
jgi:hypothetical protein